MGPGWIMVMALRGTSAVFMLLLLRMESERGGWLVP